jgi:hypothetical protein
MVTDLLTVDTDPNPDYVVFANYSVQAQDGDYSASFEALYRFQVNEGSGFTPYQDLTNEMVVGWVKSGLGQEGIDQIQTDLENQINFQKNPPVVPQLKPLPWA